jgi:hypothetical protein
VEITLNRERERLPGGMKPRLLPPDLALKEDWHLDQMARVTMQIIT